MLKPSKLAQVAREFCNYKLQVLGLCEIRWKDSGEIRTATGEHLFFSDKSEEETHHCGVGLMLSRTAKKCLVEWQPIADRIISFKIRTRCITIITRHQQWRQPMQRKTSSTNNCKMKKRPDIKILMGDLNAKVGNNNTRWKTVMGNHEVGSMNANGELLADVISSGLVSWFRFFCTPGGTYRVPSVLSPTRIPN